MDQNERIMNTLAKFGIHSPEELEKVKIKPLNISLMVSKPVAENKKKSVG